MGSRLVSFLLILCRDFGVPTLMELRLIKLSHQAIAEAITLPASPSRGY